MFDPNSVLLAYARFVESAQSSIKNKEGVQIGLTNTLKQMFGQSGQTGVVNLTLDVKEYTATLNNWCPARMELGFDGALVQPNEGGSSAIKGKYFEGYKDQKFAGLESAYLVSWLAISILNGRYPTSGAGNVEMSHKSNALTMILKDKSVKIDSISIPGPVIKGMQMPNIESDGKIVSTIAGYASQVSRYMVNNLDKPPKVMDGLAERPDWLNL